MALAASAATASASPGTAGSLGGGSPAPPVGGGGVTVGANGTPPVEVREAGRALQVRSDAPHLVSLGGGRLSTAVTLHPLPPGRVVVGSAANADVRLTAPGVAAEHCAIETSPSGVVTLLPLAGATTVDGLPATRPQRLTQGCTLGVGPSSFLRFNHPAEARLMRSILPAAAATPAPLPGAAVPAAAAAAASADDPLMGRKPPPAPRRSSARDSWGDASSSSGSGAGTGDDSSGGGGGGGVGGGGGSAGGTGSAGRGPKLGGARHLSPKVFPPSAAAAACSLPAHAVLRARSATPTSGLAGGHAALSGTQSAPGGGPPRTPPPRCLSATPGLGSEALPAPPRPLAAPSPAFNRHPSPVPGERLHLQGARRSVTPSPPVVGGGAGGGGHRRSLSAGGEPSPAPARVASPAPSLASACSVEDLQARGEEAESRRRQAQAARLREQEAERQERMRLEEILALCAEYERQAQNERVQQQQQQQQPRPPNTPTMQQNRIKTNGSLPRDKRLPSPGSAGAVSASEDELAEIFTFDLNSSKGYSNSPVGSPPVSAGTQPSPAHAQTHTPTQTQQQQQPPLQQPPGRSPYENVTLPAGGVGGPQLQYPQSPRTRIRTIVPQGGGSRDHTPSRDMCEVIENRMALSADYDFVGSLPRNKPSQQKQDQQYQSPQKSQAQRQQYMNEQNKQYQQQDQNFYFQQQEILPQKEISDKTLQQIQQQQLHQLEVKQKLQEEFKQKQQEQQQYQKPNAQNDQEEPLTKEQQLLQHQQRIQEQHQQQKIQEQQQQQSIQEQQQQQRNQDQQQRVQEQQRAQEQQQLQQQRIQDQQQQQRIQEQQQQQRIQEQQQQQQRIQEQQQQQRIQEQQQQQQQQRIQEQQQQRIQEQQQQQKLLEKQQQQQQRLQDQQKWIQEQKLQQQQWIQEQQQQQQQRMLEQQHRMQEEQQLQQQLQMHHQQRLQEQHQQQQFQHLQLQHQQRIQEQFLQQRAQEHLFKAVQTDHSHNLNAQSRQKSSEKDKFILPLGTGSPDAPSSDSVDGVAIPNSHVVSGRLNGEARSRLQREREDDSSPNSDDSPIRIERPSRWKISRDEGDLLRKERNKLLATLSGIKRKITEVEQQEEELLRGLEMERALLEGEWAAQRDRSLQDEARLSALRARVCRLDSELERGRAREIARQNDCRQRLEATAAEMQRLEQEVIRSAGCPERQREVADRLQHQHDLLEAEKKTFEDLEFRHLEEEAGWLAAREEAQREAADVGVRAAERRVRLAALEQQRRAAACAAQQEGHTLQRILAEELARLEDTRNQLREVEARIEELTQHGIISSQESSADASSDVDEPAPTSPSTSLQSPQSPQSQDDLARISRVTMGAPLEVNTGSLGRKALASLQEIERNRQLHLAQQGSQVIEEERKRVQELKRRVQDEVRAQWEERRQQQQQQRGAHCASLNSVGSDEASLTSSDVPTESASSDDALEKRLPGASVSGVNGTTAPVAVNGTGSNEKKDSDQTDPQLQDSVREKELELERDYEETRPLSDGGAYDRQLAVRMRDKVSRLQRPLTRYLPIRGAGLDLRAHVESAGHQVELCSHVSVDSSSCRGPLHKLGSRFHHWNKRWFVFDRSKRTLMYFADRAERKPRGGAFFQSIEEVYVDHLNSVKSPNPQLTFVVKTVERTYHLMAPSAEAMRIWVDVIFTGAEGYQEFEPGT